LSESIYLVVWVNLIEREKKRERCCRIGVGEATGKGSTASWSFLYPWGKF